VIRNTDRTTQTPIVLNGWPAFLAIVGIFASGWWLVGARADIPVIDDWVYAWSVQHLIDTGRLQVLPISAFYPIVQILWGALFARIGGFSFGVLRVSTLVLAVLGCWAVYLTLRELGCRRSTSLLGALALALDPVYFALSFSFMTEVPFVSVSAMALYWYVRAARRNERAAVWAGCACAIAAFLIRPIGIVLPLALAPMLVWTHEWRGALRRHAAPLAIALLMMGTLQWQMPRLFGPLHWAAIREGYLHWWFTVPVGTYLRWNLEVLVVAVFPFAPLLLAYGTRGRRAIVVGGAALGLAIVCALTLGALVMPLPPGQTWSLRDIAARSMIDGDIAPSAWSLQAAPVLKVLGLVAVAALVVVGVRGWRQADRHLPDGRRIALIVLTFALLQVVCINALWFYNDRYYLVLAPALAIAGAWALDQDGRARRIAAVMLLLWAGIAISGTRDMLAFNDACAHEARALEAAGIPSWDIDAGWAWNGWRLYAHPDALRPGANREYDVPFVTSARPTHYSITNSPLPHSEIVRVVPLAHAWWQATRAVYVVRRVDF
jgi:hypothetical protein